MRSTTLADITQLLDAEREARQRKKHRRNAHQVQAELRMYARYINEERLTTNHLPTAFLCRPLYTPLHLERGHRRPL